MGGGLLYSERSWRLPNVVSGRVGPVVGIWENDHLSSTVEAAFEEDKSTGMSVSSVRSN